MFFILLKNILSILPLDENVNIVLSEFPKYQITIDDSLVRLKLIEKEINEDFDVNVARINLKKQKYVINYGGLYLFAEESNKEVRAKMMDQEDGGFYFDVIITERGQKILRGDKCLKRGEWDPSTSGYKLIESKCDDDVYEFFDIKRSIKRLKDNNFSNSDIFIHDRNNANINKL